MEKSAHLLVRALRAAARPGSREHGADYLGTASTTLNITTPELRKLGRDWVRANQHLAKADVLHVCDLLIEGHTHQEKALASIVLGYDGDARARVTLKRLENWLTHVHGWAEVDALCANLFKIDQMLADWSGWKGLLNRLARDKNINKRRASLVLLTGPLRYSDDPRLRELAFALVERLKSEPDIMITKAISWLLRTLAIRHRAEVAAYLKANAATLPRIAVRETTTKLKTGTKSGKSAKRR